MTGNVVVQTNTAAATAAAHFLLNPFSRGTPLLFMSSIIKYAENIIKNGISGNRCRERANITP